MKKQIAISLAVIVVIIAAAVFMVKTGPRPVMRPPGSSLQKVTAIQATAIRFRPVLNSFGEAMPEKTWSAIAQVGGKIIDINPMLQNGKFLKAGDLIAKIDASEYELAIAKSKADIARLQADMAQMDVKAGNLASQKKILADMLELSRKDLKRIENLLKQGVGTQQDYEKKSKQEVARDIVDEVAKRVRFASE